MLRDMGRPKNEKNRHLPPRMTARVMKSGSIHYYYGAPKGGKIPLGSDLAAAKVKWAQLENQGSVLPDDSFRSVAARFAAEYVPKKAAATQKQYLGQLETLKEVFGAARLHQIKPFHLRGHLDKRKAKICANREIKLFSALFNWARELGITDAPNPAAGVHRNPEQAREIYVTDEQFMALWRASPPELQDALDLARLTGQRPADVLKMRRTDIEDGHLWVRQNKTGTRMGIAIEGRLKEVVERCLTRARAATGPNLVQTNEGQRLTRTMYRDRFDAARLASGQTWQFRDLRAKAATDLDDVKAAQQLLGHRSETTTAKIYRRLKGNKVKPGKG
jgi:integrase